MRAKTTIATASMSIAASLWIAAAAADLASRWKAEDIQIDGSLRDWTELISFEDALSIAVVNDKLDLYLAIATSDPQRRAQLSATGLVVWLDPNGGKKETYGIRIPGSGMSRPAGRGGRAPSNGAPEPPQPKVTFVELLGPGKDDRRRVELAAEPAPALRVASGVEMGTLLYELKIPLHLPNGEDSAYALQVRADRPLGLGLKTPKIEPPADEAARGGGMGGFGGPRGGGMGGGMGGMGGGMGGGRMGGGGPAQPKELNRWTKLTLASAP